MRWSCSLLLLLMGCAGEIPPPTQAFYHWETHLTPAPELMAKLDAKRLYVKVFDVSWTEGRVQPSALLRNDTVPETEVVPVVFITNEVFSHAGPELANDIHRLIEVLFPFPYTELQIDCDWTAGTRSAYFAFLEELHSLTDATLSCTVRLHQYRDRALQGIPPVDRAVLMAYNTGDLGSWETDNSIVDRAAINAYVSGQPPYPLPLDLAVAAYDWAAVYRRGELAYLINEPDLNTLADTTYFTPLGPMRYRVDSATYYEGIYLYRDDRIRREVADTALARQVADELWPQIATPESRYVIYYRIGSRQWN